jgi:mannose-1-phosphate guanylyltransferase
MSNNALSSKLYSLIMAGGRGTRFWPESTSKKPKQYLNLTGKESLLAETLKRFEGLIDKDNRYIVTTKDQEDLATNSSQNYAGENNIIFEPSGRNTAPCILLSLVHLLNNGATNNDVVAIVPSDHVILNHNGFRKTIQNASKAALDHKKIVTIGITPNFPHTGYGYIKKSSKVERDMFNVEAFKEKPNFETAKNYIATGKYYWNAGMFVSTIGLLMEEFEKHAPEIFEYSSIFQKNLNNFKQLTESYNQVPKDSIDYAIMEKSQNVFTTPASFDWNDLGSWDALESVIEKQQDNVILSKDNNFYLDNSLDNIVYAPNQFVSLINVNDMIVVSNDKAVVVMPKSDSQKIKNVVEHLKDQKFGKDLI